MHTCRDQTICNAKKKLRRTAELRLDASQNVRQMRLGDRIVDASPVFLRLQQTATLSHPQVFRRHVAGNAARLGQFSDRILALQQHLHHPQAMRMRQRPQALGACSIASRLVSFNRGCLVLGAVIVAASPGRFGSSLDNVS